MRKEKKTVKWLAAPAALIGPARKHQRVRLPEEVGRSNGERRTIEKGEKGVRVPTRAAGWGLRERHDSLPLRAIRGGTARAEKQQDFEGGPREHDIS